MNISRLAHKLLKIHLYRLGFILLNSMIGILTDYSLNQNLIFALKVILCISGVFLFFMSLKPFKKEAIYFTYYILTAIISVLFWLRGGIFLALLTTLFLYPIFPKMAEYESDNIGIYKPFQGFMAPCCLYEIAEPKVYFFEKRLGSIKIDRIDPDRDEFIFSNNKILHKHRNYNIPYFEMQSDTTEILEFEK